LDDEGKRIRDIDIDLVDAQLAVLAFELRLENTQQWPSMLRWIPWVLGESATAEQVQQARADVARLEAQLSEAEAAFRDAASARGLDPDLALARFAVQWARGLAAKLLGIYAKGPSLMFHRLEPAHDLVHALDHATARVERVAGWIDGQGEQLHAAVEEVKGALLLPNEPQPALTESGNQAARKQVERVAMRRERRVREVDAALTTLERAIDEAMDSLGGS
jgi:hypothetical protein